MPLASLDVNEIKYGEVVHKIKLDVGEFQLNKSFLIVGTCLQNQDLYIGEEVVAPETSRTRITKGPSTSKSSSHSFLHQPTYPVESPFVIVTYLTQQMANPSYVKPDYSALKNWDLSLRDVVFNYDDVNNEWTVLDVSIVGKNDGENELHVEFMPDHHELPFEFRRGLKEGAEGFKQRIDHERDDAVSIYVVVNSIAFARRSRVSGGFNTAMHTSLKACFYPPTEQEYDQVKKKLEAYCKGQERLDQQIRFRNEREADPVFNSVQNWNLTERTAISYTSRERLWSVLEVKIHGVNDGKGQITIRNEVPPEYLPIELGKEIPKGVARFHELYSAHRNDSPSLTITLTRACYHRVDSSRFAFNLATFKSLRACFLPKDIDLEKIAERRLSEFRTDAQLEHDRRNPIDEAEHHALSLEEEAMNASLEEAETVIKVKYKDGSEIKTEVGKGEPIKPSFQEYFGITIILIINFGMLIALVAVEKYALCVIPVGLTVLFIYGFQKMYPPHR